MKIDDGAGTGNVAKVTSENRLTTAAVTRSEALESAYIGGAFNFNTGEITITGNTAALYIKNTGTKALNVETVVIGISSGSFGGNSNIFIVRNPTAGTIIDNEAGLDMNANRNFGSTKTATVTTYKGADGYTFTNGTDAALIGQNGQGRSAIPLGLILETGASLGVRVEPNLSGSSVNVYVAAIAHFNVSNGI